MNTKKSCRNCLRHDGCVDRPITRNATSARIKFWKDASAITEGEWLARIEAIADGKIRIQVACILWWDWGPRDQRHPGASWTMLDKYLEEYTLDKFIDREAIFGALTMRCGYPADIARARMDALYKNLFRVEAAEEAKAKKEMAV